MRGTLLPVLDEFAVTFRVMHGFSSASVVNSIAEATSCADRPLIVFYVGDYDPSGLYMSERDLPERLSRYGGEVDLRRLALTAADVMDPGLPGFDAATKRKDPRYKWFVANHGTRCWELDAMSPPVLRQRVRNAILAEINQAAWEHCAMIEAAERESLRKFKWG